MTEPSASSVRLPNLPHLADRMAAIKTEVATLEVEYAELRDRIVSGGVALAGELWRAKVTEVAKRRILLADAERLLPASLFDLLVQNDHSGQRRAPAHPTAKAEEARFRRRG
jgi:hypothetical protein